jgi:hypothetical protein
MDWQNLIVGAIIGFIVSIIANIYTDKYKDWIARRTINTKNKRIEQLKKDLERFSDFKKEPTKFYLTIARRIFLNLMGVQALILGVFYVLGGSIIQNTDLAIKQIIPIWPAMPPSIRVYIDMVFTFLLLALFMSAYFLYDSTMKDISTFIHFDEFKKSVNDRIKELS